VIQFAKKGGFICQSEKATLALPGSHMCSCGLENQSSIFLLLSRRDLCIAEHWSFWRIGAEMNLGELRYFKADPEATTTTGASIVPIAFLWSLDAGPWLLFWHWKGRILSRSIILRSGILLQFDLVLLCLKSTNCWSRKAAVKTGLDGFEKIFWELFCFQYAVKIFK